MSFTIMLRPLNHHPVHTPAPQHTLTTSITLT
jgi:hypothetical protein